MIYHDLPVKNGDVDLFMLKYQRVSKKKTAVHMDSHTFTFHNFARKMGANLEIWALGNFDKLFQL
jgi:hypothetical protein